MATPDSPFTFGVRIGIVFIVEAASLSLIAVVGLLLYLAIGQWRFKKKLTEVHFYLLNLLVCDLLQAIGGIMNTRWVIQASVTDGPFCTTQGILKQIADIGVSLSSLIIGVHTFNVLVFRWDVSRRMALAVLACVWVFISLAIGISYATHKGQNYYGDTEYWCWVTSRFHVQQIVLDYLWMWIAAFCNCIIYVFLAFVVYGFIEVNKFKIRLPNHEERVIKRRAPNSIENRGATLARQMLYYPAVYIVTVLPIAISRFSYFAGQNIPFAATAFSDILFSCSGLFNVTLFVMTRPTLLSGRNSDRRTHDVRRKAPKQGHLPDSSIAEWDPYGDPTMLSLSQGDFDVTPSPSTTKREDQGHLPDDSTGTDWMTDTLDPNNNGQSVHGHQYT